MLRRAFLTSGLPRRITFDHGTVFFDNTSPSPFPTSLHLWLLADGALTSALPGLRCPTDHAKIERTHQTMTLQALLGQYWPDQATLWAALDARRAMLNQHIPSSVLHGRAPLQAYPEAAHGGSLLPSRMGSRDARPGACLCVPGHLSLVSPHPRQRPARSWGL